jgi:hypothetical protein
MIEDRVKLDSVVLWKMHLSFVAIVGKHIRLPKTSRVSCIGKRFLKQQYERQAAYLCNSNTYSI